MKNAKYIPFFTVVVLSLLSCAYNPALPDVSFICGEGGKCPTGHKCYGGQCMKEAPPCMSNTDPQFIGWPDDSDLEPNDHPDMAITLPCGDDGVAATDRSEYATRCPIFEDQTLARRGEYTNGFMNLLVCPNGDRDFYKIYLLPDETVAFRVMFQHNVDPPRDVDARIWRWDFFNERWIEDVSVGLSTNDNEGDAATGALLVSTATGSANPQGWYYLEVFGKGYADLNLYTVSFTLNASDI